MPSTSNLTAKKDVVAFLEDVYLRFCVYVSTVCQAFY